MLAPKKSKLLTTNYSLLILGGIFISLILNFAFWTFNYASAQGLALPDPTGTGLAEGSLVDTILAIINAALAFAGVIALIVLIYGGYVWMTSGGIPQRIVLAKKILLSAVVGFIIILTSWAIVNFIINGMNGGPGGGGGPPGGGGGPPPEPPYVFKVIDYSPKGPDIPICRAIQATFDREYQSGSITSGAATGTFHLMKYCIDNAQCNGIGLGNCDRSVLGITGTFCAEDIAGAFIYIDPNTVAFKPTDELEKMTDYKVLIDGGASGVQSGSGADCNGAFDICKDWDFKTGDFSDKVPPQVQKVSPVDGADNVCLVKSIAAQFNEEMFKPSLTAAGAFSTTPAHNFSPSAPSFTVMRESPKNPYAANTDYYPLLNADTIMDACFNKLDGNANGTAENSPVDDYGDPLPDEANPNWQFKTGETTQCVPKIDAISPSDSYYENPGNTLEITGENFDDIADTVMFNKNLAVGIGTTACFNASFTDTDQACLIAVNWDGVSIPNKITINVPAGENDSNGAITGPVKVKVGQFQCTGQTTCKGGANKGLNCVEVNELTDCPGSLCGDTGSCDGGVNAGLGCDDNIIDCPGSESAGVNLNVLSPHINSISPKIGGPGAWITVSGTQFGTTAGTVRVQNPLDNLWVDAVLPCANSWSDNYIIIEIPTNFPTNGIVNIQVIASTDSRHSNINGDFALNASAPNPGICAIAPDCGPTGTFVEIGGKRFGTTGSVFFGDAAATTNSWIDTQITATSPTQPADGAYPVKVTVNSLDSNTLPFSTICSGRPKVVESLTCNNATQSPSPYKNTAGSPDAVNDACINTSAISARFNMDMDEADLVNANIKLYKCNGYQNTCTAEITPTGIDILNLDTSSEGFKFNLPAGEPVQNTWYQGWISGSVRSELSTAMGTDYSWDFHISDSPTACPVDSLTVNPTNKIVSVGATINYTAVPAAANCNFIGACTDYVYNWSTSGTPIPHSSVPIPSNTCNVSVSADAITPIGDPDDIMADIPAESVSSIAQLTITSGGGPGAAVCGNGKIDAGEQCDDKNTFADDGCSATCQRETPAIFSVKPANVAANVCKNAAVEITFTGLMNFSTITPTTIRLLQGVAPVAGSIQARYIDSDSNGAMDQTLATIFPSSVFADTTNYSVEVLGGVSGVKSKYGAEIDASSCGAAMNWSIDHCASSFTTGTEICKIDKVSIILEKDFNPDPSISNINSYYGPDLFTCAGKNDCPDDFDPLAQNQHNAIAEAKDATGLTLGGIAYSWTKSTDAPFTLVDPDANDEDLMVQADPKSGIGALTVKADGGLAGIKTASTNVTVAPCDNPWQPTGTYPYKDDLASSPANPTNFSLWYCRDAGDPGTADDLPDLSIIKRDIPAGELIREFFFYDAANPNDALGLRVYTNLNHWPAKEWYDNRAPNKQGAPASTTVDGWEGIQAGRTIYVNAANHTGIAPPLMNIYLMSHSDKISTNLRNIYNQLKSNWKFAITEYDDGTDGSSLNPPADRGHLRKLQRDTRRITDLYGAAVDLYQSKTSKGKYPLMPSGSYIGGNSTSVWPSWDGALSKEVGAPMPHDPISQMSSLIGWWKLDDDASGETSDSGPYDRDGTLNAPVLRSGAACKFGSCLEFNGTSDYIDLGSFNGAYSNKLTVSAWIKTKQNTGNDANAKWDDIVAGECGNFLFSVVDGYLGIEDQCGNADNKGTDMDPLRSKRKVDDDKWHYVAATYDGLVMKLYIDGAFESSGPANGDFTTNIGNLFIGVGDTMNASLEYFDGSIDEVRIWNTPLGDAEINNLFKSNAAKFGSSEDSGWDQTKNAFSCIAGADYDTHIYHYQQESGGADFSLYAALEWVGGDGSTWRQAGAPFNPCNGIGDSSCSCYNYRQQEVDAANLGLCQNKQWDSSLGERCDGSVTTGLNGLEGRICPTGKCVGGTNDTKDCTDNLQCPDGGTCTPNDPTCDVDICEPYCAGGPAVKAVCGNGKVESPIENCECSKICVGGSQNGLTCSDDINCPGGSCTFNQNTCGVAKGLMNEYYCYDDGVEGDDLNAAAIIAEEIDDQFTDTVQCSPTTCNLICGSAVPVLAEVNNGMYEPWVEQCEPARGYCSGNSAFCTDDLSCGANGPCIALGNGGYYCDNGGAIQCNNGTRGCPAEDTLTSCIGGAVEWNECGGGDFPPKPYNYLDEEINYTDYTAKTGASTVDGLYGWCFR